MNRRAFIQSVIAVPLVAAGFPRARSPWPSIRSNSQHGTLVVINGDGFRFGENIAVDVTGMPWSESSKLFDVRAIAQDWADQIDQQFLEQWRRANPKPTIGERYDALTLERIEPAKPGVRLVENISREEFARRFPRK